MATQLKQGDEVQVIDREATPADEKGQTFFNHYRNLTGILEKVYDDGIATVVVDEESLPEEVLQRHKALTDTARQKWLDGLSNEARSKLTPEEQQFKMRYTILLESQDLIKKGGKQPRAKGDTGKSRAAALPEPGAEDEAPKAVRSSDLDRAEEEYLKARRQGAR